MLEKLLLHIIAPSGCGLASLSRYSVLIERALPLPNSDYTLKICNEEGKVIEELSNQAAFVEGSIKLGEIFDIARRRAMGVEKVLDQVFVALRK